MYEDFIKYLNGFKEQSTPENLRVVYLVAIRKLMLTDEKTSNQLLVNMEVLPVLIMAVQSNSEKLISESLWVLTNIAGGEKTECV